MRSRWQSIALRGKNYTALTIIVGALVGCGGRRPQDMNGLSELSVSEAESLVQSHKNLLLDGLKTLPPEIATALSQQSRGLLFIRGLTDLSPEAAQLLTDQRQGTIFFGGLTNLSPDLAQSIKGHRGMLVFSGLKTIPFETAEVLVGHEGNLYLGYLDRELIEYETAEKLKENSRIVLPEWVYEEPLPRRRRRRRS